MFKPRVAATAASSRRWHTESLELELSEAELGVVLGGQSQPSPDQMPAHEVVASIRTVMADAVLTPLRAGFQLAVAAGDYAHWAAEYQQSRAISQERGMQLDAEQREAEAQQRG